MQQIISKSQFKAQALEFLRRVEEKKEALIITHSGKPVAKVIPYKKEDPLKLLKNTILFYKDPQVPVGENLWEASK